MRNGLTFVRKSLHRIPHSLSGDAGGGVGEADIRTAHPPSLTCAAFHVAARRPRSAGWLKNVTTFARCVTGNARAAEMVA